MSSVRASYHPRVSPRPIPPLASSCKATLSRRDFLVTAGIGATSLACASRSPTRQSRAATRIPLVYDEHGGLFVEARINDRDPVRLILDTGASRSTLSSEFAKTLGLEVRPGDPIEGSAGIVESSQALAELEVPGLDAQRIDFAVYGFASYDKACVGILGYEFVARAPFRLRYRERVLEWHAPALPGELPLVVDRRIPRITARINERPVELRIDTGAAFPPGDDAYLNLTEEQAQTLALTGKPVAVFTATGTGNAVLELPVHALGSLQVGEVRLPRAFAIVQPRVGYFARSDAVGFLGNSVLDKLDPYFDYARARFSVGA